MSIIPQNSKNKEEILKSFWLYFYIKSHSQEWIDYKLPIPTILKHINNGYFIGWAIDGYFATPKNREFLNDIIARFLISFENIERLPFKPTPKDLNEKYAHIYKKVYKLRKFSKQLKSLPTKKKIPKRADTFEDFTFWAIKLYAEDLIRANGFIVYQALEDWALSQFLHKERSTIRAKCRSVWNWYNDRDFQIAKKYTNFKEYLEETMASRAEHAKKIKANEEKRNYAKVVDAINGLMANELKKKNGTWSITKIAKYTGLHRETVSKHLKAYLQQSKID